VQNRGSGDGKGEVFGLEGEKGMNLESAAVLQSRVQFSKSIVQLHRVNMYLLCCVVLSVLCCVLCCVVCFACCVVFCVLYSPCCTLFDALTSVCSSIYLLPSPALRTGVLHRLWAKDDQGNRPSCS
jgi:hypothetical protein